MAWPAENLVLLTGTSETDRVQSVPAAELIIHLYDRERVPLLRYLSALGVQLDAAEDLIQETFLKLHQHLLAKGDRSHLRAWLYRVAHNGAQNRRASAFHGRIAPLAYDFPHTSESPEERVLNTEQQHQLHKGMNDLSGPQRQCLILRVQGFKYREIADVLQLATSTVAENIQRAISTLKKDQ